MLIIKKVKSLLFVVLFIGSGAFAQAVQNEEVSDEEVEQFAGAFKQIQDINQEAQQEMISSVEEAGLDVQRYNEIQQAQQNPDQQVDASDEELEQFKAATQEMGNIQVEAQQKMQEKIKEEGLTLARYQEIGSAIQSDPGLQKKLQEYLQGG